MTWQECYKIIEFIEDKHFRHSQVLTEPIAEAILEDVNQLNYILNGFEPWDEAFRRFKEYNDEDE